MPNRAFKILLTTGALCAAFVGLLWTTMQDGTQYYMEVEEVMADPEHEEHERMLEWYGKQFDPEDIDERRLHMIINDFAARRRGPLKSHRTGKRPWS